MAVSFSGGRTTTVYRQREALPVSAAELRLPEQGTQQNDPAPGDGQGRQAGQQDGLDGVNIRETADWLVLVFHVSLRMRRRAEYSPFFTVCYF